MQAIKCGFPPGMIGVISGDLSRFPNFIVSLVQLLVPQGSQWKWIRGNGFAQNRNTIINGMMNYPNLEWCFFMDDDHVFEHDILLKLLAHNVDIIQPLISTRKPPFYPYAYYWHEKDNCFHSAAWADLPESGLLKVDGTSAGGMLVKRRVFEKMEKPWFEEGRFSKDTLGEDLWFSKKGRELGFDSYLDLDTLMGHMTTAEVWPSKNQDNWGVDLDLLNDVRLRMPALADQTIRHDVKELIHAER